VHAPSSKQQKSEKRKKAKEAGNREKKNDGATSIPGGQMLAVGQEMLASRLSTEEIKKEEKYNRSNINFGEKSSR